VLRVEGLGQLGVAPHGVAPCAQHLHPHRQQVVSQRCLEKHQHQVITPGVDGPASGLGEEWASRNTW